MTKENGKEPLSSATGGSLVPIDNELLRGVKVTIDAVLGRGEMTADMMMSLKPGSVVTLDASLADQVELFLGESLVARGEIVAVGDHYGVRIVDVAAVR